MLRKLIIMMLLGFIPLASSAQDLAISPAVVAPVSGCYLPNNQIITIIIVNVGGATVTGFDISYSLNAGAPVVETVPAFIPMGWTYNYSFIAPADFSACQIHTLDFVLTVVGDPNNTNNTLSTTVTSDCAPVPGSLVLPDTLCSGINSGNLSIVGYTGTIENWVFSNDGGSTWSWTGWTSNTKPYTNIATQELWWVLVGSPYGFCPDDSTEVDTIEVVPQSVGGFLPLDFDICDNGNGGQVDLTGYVGSVVQWEISQDGGTTWTTIPSNTSDSLIYWNLLDTTMYQVLVQNNVCPAVYSDTVVLTLIPGSDAGSIVGESLVCNFENDSSLEVNPVVGDAIDWYISSDNGTTWTSTGTPDSIYPYTGLLTYTLFAAIVQEANCPYDTVYHSIIVLPLGITAGPNVSIYEEDTTQLAASGGSFFLWFPATDISDINISNPLVWPLVTTTYNVQITDINGCTDTASVLVTVLPDITAIIIPNLLTPNSDGFNDYLNIQNLDTYPNNELHIFNSYGQVIFTASPYNNDWDATFGGSSVPDGTYYYVLNLNDPVNAPDPYQGVITILGND